MFELRVDDVNLIDIDWKSPLQLKINDACEEFGIAAAKAFDDMVFEAVAEVGIEVDRDELIKALAYDRGQYEKGYGDGYRAAKDAIVRCKDCDCWCEEMKVGHADLGNESAPCSEWSDHENGHIRYTKATDFCSYGERSDK